MSGRGAGSGVVSSHQLDLVEDVCEDVVIIARGGVVAAGAIDELKSRSGRRHLEVEVVGSDGAWLDGDGSLTVLERDGGRVKLLVSDQVDLDALLGRARPPVRSARSPTSRRTSELFMEAVTRPIRQRWRRRGPGGRSMSRWRSVWLVAKREILERGRSRGFLFSVALHDAARGRLVRRPDRPLRRRRDKTIGVVQPAPAGLDAAIDGDGRGRSSSRSRSSLR